MRPASHVTSIIQTCHPAPWQLHKHRLQSIFRYDAAGRGEGLAWRKPTPEPDGNGNVRFPVVQLLSNVHVLMENMIRNGNLLVFCIPHPDKPRALHFSKYPGYLNSMSPKATPGGMLAPAHNDFNGETHSSPQSKNYTDTNTHRHPIRLSSKQSVHPQKPT